jgi:hypothetical protein
MSLSLISFPFPFPYPSAFAFLISSFALETIPLHLADVADCTELRQHRASLFASPIWRLGHVESTQSRIPHELSEDYLLLSENPSPSEADVGVIGVVGVA